MDVTREKLHCAVCGYDWFKPLGAPDPDRCARKSCRSKRWKDGGRGRGPVGKQWPAEPTGNPVLDAMRPAAQRIVERVAGELQEGAGDEPDDRRYVPIEEV